MNCDKISELLQDGSLIVDVRTPEEFSNGHVAGSINIPLHKLPYNLDLCVNKIVYLYCRSGARSDMAAKYLQTEGITAQNIGGINNFIGCIQF